jgi:hypothetical protein
LKHGPNSRCLVRYMDRCISHRSVIACVGWGLVAAATGLEVISIGKRQDRCGVVGDDTEPNHGVSSRSRLTFSSQTTRRQVWHSEQSLFRYTTISLVIFIIGRACICTKSSRRSGAVSMCRTVPPILTWTRSTSGPLV